MSSAGGARRERQSGYPMIPVDEALLLVLTHTTPLKPKKVSLSACVGCVLAEDVTAPEPQPAFAASIMDGYAVLSSDGPGTYPVVAAIRAGTDPDAQGVELKPGQVAYITTGSKLPKGADAVVKVEDSEDAEGGSNSGSKESSVKVVKGVGPGQWVRPIGSDVAKGQLLLHKGTQIGAAEVGLLASVGVCSVLVVAKPKVGVMSTGDELTQDKTQDTTGGKVHDSNRPSLLALYSTALGLGAEGVVDLGVVRDSDGTQGLTDAFTHAFNTLGCDVVVTSGGVSMGDADLLKPALNALGTVHFGRLNMKPGKPTTFATVQGQDGTQKLVFALPGNPVSCLVCSHLLVSPALRRLQGHSPHNCMLPQVVVRLGSEVTLDPERPEYQRITLTYDHTNKAFVGLSTGRQISSRLLSMASANALICLPAGNGKLPVGSEVPGLLIGPLPPPPPPQCYHPKAALLHYTPPQTQTQAHTQGGGGGAVLEGCPCCKPSEDGAPSSATTSTSTGGSSVVLNGVGSVRVGLVVVSDRASSGEYEDKSGPAMATILTGSGFLPGGASVVGCSVVADETEAIQQAVINFTDNHKVELVFTSGGTGFAPRDVTPEAVKPLLHKEAPGLVFRIMQVGTQHTPLAVISRPVAGVRHSTLVVTLPGSPKAVKENLEALQPLLPKIISLLQTATCDHKDMATASK